MTTTRPLTRLAPLPELAGLQQTGNTSAFGGFDQTIEITALDQSLGNGAAIKLAVLKVVIQSDSHFREHDGKARIGVLDFAASDPRGEDRAEVIYTHE